MTQGHKTLNLKQKCCENFRYHIQPDISLQICTSNCIS